MYIDNIGGPFTKEEVQQFLIDEVIQELFWQVAEMRLQQCDCSNIGAEDLCTVYTTFNGGYKARFSFCAERSMMKRIAGNMAQEPVTDPEDIEEYMKEFVNVICGHIVGFVFRKTKTAARFHCPQFAEGYYIPPDDNDDTIVRTYYINEYSENAMLLYDKILPMVG